MRQLLTPDVIAFTVTLLASLAMVLTQRWHGRFSLDGAVGVQKMHSQPTLRVGGVAIVLGLLDAYSLTAPDVQVILGPMLLAGIPAFAASLLEDITKKWACCRACWTPLPSACWPSNAAPSPCKTAA